MRQFILLLCLTFVAAEAIIPGYNYKQPQLSQPVRQQTFTAPVKTQTQITTQTNSGIYSTVQAPPLNSFNVQNQVQAQNVFVPPAPPTTFVPAPLPLTTPIQQQQTGYVLPQPAPVQPVVVQHPLPAPIPQTIQLPAAPIAQPVQQFYQPPQVPQRQVFADQLSLPIAAPQPQLQPQLQVQPQIFPRPQTAIVTKDIYIHSAPEDHEEVNFDQQLDNMPVRKNYRIVFIKAPSQNVKLASAALKHAQTANEEKTVIYVLSKKPDLTEVQNQLIQSQSNQKTHKPEVYFIKYKTQEEAQRAQQEIQAQYDALGGSTHISDEGIAPLTSVGALNLGSGHAVNTGSYTHHHHHHEQQTFQTGSGASGVNFGTGVSQKYLPVKTLK